jgi:hypothetical protein
LLDVFVAELVPLDAALVCWRLVGLNVAMDGAVGLLSPTFECGGDFHQLCLQAAAAEDPDHVLAVNADALGLAEGGSAAEAEGGASVTAARLDEVLLDFLNHARYQVLRYPPELSSAGRKHVHTVAQARGLQHTTQTIAGARQVWVYKPVDAHVGGAFDIFVRTVAPPPSAPSRVTALRVEVVSEGRGTKQKPILPLSARTNSPADTSQRLNTFFTQVRSTASATTTLATRHQRAARGAARASSSAATCRVVTAPRSSMSSSSTAPPTRRRWARRAECWRAGKARH